MGVYSRCERLLAQWLFAPALSVFWAVFALSVAFVEAITLARAYVKRQQLQQCGAAGLCVKPERQAPTSLAPDLPDLDSEHHCTRATTGR